MTSDYGRTRSAPIPALLLLLCGCVSSAPVTTHTTLKPQELGWLNGCWYSAQTDTQEFWASAGDGYYFGHSVTFEDDHVVFFEQLRIKFEQSEGSLFAYPGGDGPYEFPVTEQGSSRIVFANSAHDYPQRIEYRMDAALLVASISLLDGSRSKHWSYTQCALAEK